MSDYIATIGIECHVQLKTRTKLFSAVANDAREAPANTLISHIDLGMPGALPVLNEKAVELGMRAAFALNTSPQKFSTFDRKHYFYPDLPSGYQITQFNHPIIIGGHVDIEVDGEKKRVGITRAHLEADAGKSTHPAGKDYSLVDLNRAGTPLLEIVSEPDMHTAIEAKAYAHELYLLMKYAGVSDANLYYGNMRFDVNVSISKYPDAFGTRTETKNLNSFRSIEKAIEFEIKRQKAVLEKGEEVVQETRGWDDDKQVTFSQRTKEDSHDYRYFPDPDIPPVQIDDSLVQKIQSDMPKMPGVWREQLTALGIDEAHIDTLLEAEVEQDKVTYLSYLEKQLDDPDRAKFIANWYVNVLIPIVREEAFEPHADSLSLISVIFDLFKSDKLSSTNAKSLYIDLIHTNLVDWPEGVEDYAKTRGYIQVSDEGAILAIVKKVLAENSKAAEDVKSGEMKAIGFLVGQVMKESKGQANPGLAKELISKELGV